MSKKIVAFKMPARPAPFAESAAARRSLVDEEQASPIAPVGDRANEATGPSRPDQWVRGREVGAVHRPAETNGVTIDLAAERDLPEVAALAFLAPAALGWFWLSNAMNRVWRGLD